MTDIERLKRAIKAIYVGEPAVYERRDPRDDRLVGLIVLIDFEEATR